MSALIFRFDVGVIVFLKIHVKRCKKSRWHGDIAHPIEQGIGAR